MANPGGGKSTILEGLKARGFQLTDLPFRAKMDREVGNQTPLGVEIDRFRQAGLLVPNEHLLPLVDEAFDDVGESRLLGLDGFPREKDQLRFAIERTRHAGFERIAFLHIDTPMSESMRRLAARKRDAMDVDPEKLARRFDEFEQITLPMIMDCRRNADKLGVEFHLIDGFNLLKNMDAFMRMLDL